MKTYPVGNPVTVTIPFIDHNGDPIEPTSLLVTVFDENGITIAGPTSPAVVSGDTELEYTIAANLNATAGVRVVDCKITAGTYSVTQSETVMLTERKSLVVPVNSFQTYEMALMMASGMVGLAGWAGTSEDMQRNALEESFLRLTRLGYRIRRPEDVDTMSYIPDDDEIIQPRYWPLMTLTRWNSLPARFRDALRRAQIAESNELLTGDVIGQKRRMGILSESIGESSMMFRTGRPLDLGISSVALGYLTGYIDMRITLTRS